MMSLVITFLSLPIGLLLILNERRHTHKYDAVFHNFLDRIKADKRLNTRAKIARLRAMLERNHYHILSLNNDEIIAEKKLFSPGWLTFGLGLLYLGAIIYIIYYFKIQKAHKVKFVL